MRFERVKMTPDLAEGLLASTTRQRPLDRNHVERLKADIVAGRWSLTHECIALDSDMQVLDGQHRLRAVIETGRAIDCVIAYDCDPASFAAIGVNVRVRGASDLLALQCDADGARRPKGLQNVVSVGAAMLARSSGKYPGRREAAAVAYEHMGLIQEILTCLYSSPQARLLIRTSSVAAFVNAALAHGWKAVRPLVLRLRDEAWTSAGDPMKALWDRMVSASARRENLPRPERYRFAEAAVADALAGRSRFRFDRPRRDRRGGR